MNKKLLFITTCLIIILAIVLISTSFEKKPGILTYPSKISIWEKMFADVSQVFTIEPIKKIEVDLSEQKMKIFEDKEIVGEFSISTGNRETPTPPGNFKVYNKSIMVYSEIANCWLPFWIGFTTDGLYGFHEVPICKEGRKGLEELGKPASIGCVRLGVKDSELFYKWAKVGTPVIIYGKEPPAIQKETPDWCYNFEINLKFGETNNEVKNLQIALTKEEVYQGSIGNYFGTDVLTAVIIFQEKYPSEILSPWDLTKGTGFVGSTTRNKLNKLYGCH
jgi:hypothetical protein